MKKIEKRTVVCLILTLILLLGVGLFVVRFFLSGESWASFSSCARSRSYRSSRIGIFSGRGSLR